MSSVFAVLFLVAVFGVLGFIAYRRYYKRAKAEVLSVVADVKKDPKK